MQAAQITHSIGTQISIVDIRSNGIVFSLIINQRLSSPLFATPAPNTSSKASGEDYSLVGVYSNNTTFSHRIVLGVWSPMTQRFLLSPRRYS